MSAWGQAEFSTIERRALALAAHKMSASPGRAVNDRDLPANTVISVGLVKTPDLDPAAGPWGAIQNSDTDPGYIRRAG